MEEIGRKAKVNHEKKLNHKDINNNRENKSIDKRWTLVFFGIF